MHAHASPLPRLVNNFIHRKSGSNEYNDKQTNITKLTLSSTYMYINSSVARICCDEGQIKLTSGLGAV